MGGIPLLVEYFNELPQVRGSRGAAQARWQAALEKFRTQVAGRYLEGTLLRLLSHADSRTRRAAALALGLLGTMRSNKALALCLRDDDAAVRDIAEDALWNLWFRADSDEHNQELQRLRRLRDLRQALAGLNALIKKAPRFAEAFNQRAIVYFRLEEYRKAVADCERTLKLNPYHFGAQSGMAQCYLKMQKPRAALRAFRGAFRIHPHLRGIVESIRSLEDVLGSEPEM